MPLRLGLTVLISDKKTILVYISLSNTLPDLVVVALRRRINDFPQMTFPPSKSTLQGDGGLFKISRSSMKSEDSPGS